MDPAIEVGSVKLKVKVKYKIPRYYLPQIAHLPAGKDRDKRRSGFIICANQRVAGNAIRVFC